MASDSLPGRPPEIVNRQYEPAQKAEAVGLAMAIGAKAAGARLGISRRTISSWMRSPSTEVQAAILTSRQDVAARLWEAVSVGTEAVLEGLRDPKARLGDKASALRIVVEAHALVAGQPTSRTAVVDETPQPSMTWEQERQAREFLDALLGASDDELAEWAADGGLAMLRDAEQQAAAEQLTDGKDATP